MASKKRTFVGTGARFAGAEIEGLEDFEAALRTMNEDVQGVILRDAVKAGGEITRSVAEQLAPRESGDLSRHIEVEIQWTRSQDKAEINVGMEKGAFYGRFQETGTQFMPAQPFLRPALDNTKDDVIAEIRDRLAASILSSIGR